MSGSSKSVLREYVEAALIATGLALFIILFVAQSFLVEGDSMWPTLEDGERILVDKLSYRFRDPARGEIIVFRYPADPTRRFIKRVIGVPGDEVMIRGSVVYVNGQALSEEYIAEPTRDDYGPVVVPEDAFFVLGDNRNASEDSRRPNVGFVPRDLIVGRALLVYWPLSDLGLIRVPESLSAQNAEST